MGASGRDHPGAGGDPRGRTSLGGAVRLALLVVLLLGFLGDAASLLAGHASWLGTGAGAAVRELALIVALGGVLVLHARSMQRIDRDRRRAIASLAREHDSLQARVDEQARIEAELRDSERRYRSLADAMPQIVWATRPDGGTEYFNRRWLDYTGQTLDQALDWGWTAVVHPDDSERCQRIWLEAVRSGERYNIEYRLRRHDGEYRWHLGRGEPMRDEARAIVRWFGTCTDIDDQKRVEAELRRIQEGLADRVSERTRALQAANEALVAEVAERKLAEEAARAASRSKGEFLANMSHEIRTPMNGILGMTELTLGTALTTSQRESLQIVASSAEALLTVIDDILDFSKIEAGKLTLDPVPFAIRDAATDTLRSLALRAHDKGLELACRIAPDVPEVVVGDPGRLRQVLVNLVGNAIKFTETGEVVVAIDRDPDADPAPEPGVVALRFAVRDTGIGIPPQKRGAIFAAFEQADGSTTRRYGGTGLGLAISARLVELMGGTIGVTDGPGGGSLFRFGARFADPEPGRAGRLADAPAPLDGLRVLVVDDNATSRQILREHLLGWGCRPTTVADRAEARAALRAATLADDPFAVVLLDQTPPGAIGQEIGTASPTGAGPKLVLLTSGGEPAAGDPADGRLAKPIRPSEVLDLLMGLIAGEPTGPAADRPARSGPICRPTPPPTPAPTGPARPLRILLAEDHPVNQRVATRLIEDMGHQVTVAADGLRAVAAATTATPPFDLALMDVQMPGMDGFEALAAIRGHESRAAADAADRGEPARPYLPIVALTAHAMSGDRERCLTAGFDDYLAKPVHAACLRALLDRSHAADAASAPPAPEPPGPHRRVALAQ